MNPEEQRTAIAKACGLDVIHEPAGPADRPDAWRTGFFTPKAAKQRHERWPSSCVVSVIPDYLNDLNAMHEAEKMLDDRERFRICLNSACGFRRAWKDSECYHEIVHAPAAQRAEAFLRTLNLWTDDE